MVESIPNVWWDKLWHDRNKCSGNSIQWEYRKIRGDRKINFLAEMRNGDEFDNDVEIGAVGELGKAANMRCYLNKVAETSEVSKDDGLAKDS